MSSSSSSSWVITISWQTCTHRNGCLLFCLDSDDRVLAEENRWVLALNVVFLATNDQPCFSPLLVTNHFVYSEWWRWQWQLQLRRRAASVIATLTKNNPPAQVSEAVDIALLNRYIRELWRANLYQQGELFFEFDHFWQAYVAWPPSKISFSCDTWTITLQ